MRRDSTCRKTVVTGRACSVMLACCLLQAALAARAAEKVRITELQAASGKAYVVGEEDLSPGKLQFIDRDYTFDYIPQVLKGATTIRTAGNDKMLLEDQCCVTFRVDAPVTVYVVYGDKLRVLPAWLQSWTNTRYKVTRKDSNTTTLKGLFTLYAKDFAPGLVVLNGNLSKRMAEDEEFRRMKGGTFCMYSVVVVPKP